MELKLYDLKSFWVYELKDYWNLSEHPLYIKFESKTIKPYFRINEDEFEGATAIYSITGFVRYYGQFDWLMKSKNKKDYVIDYTQSMINIPWTHLK
ncbi:MULTISPECIES: hypothetical protein [Empedobacter]|uniref:hypothetical protein n=1 Tax=Empedobacter TaxID=59734 RepID=UPI002577FB27|nr:MULTISPECIES: hypothetical protein [Empedobacter]MDM1042114.1 hypothetical protein [Empedobacter brevis]MDM1136011.1 hypothetical protein [Empedobacter sp. R750]